MNDDQYRNIKRHLVDIWWIVIIVEFFIIATLFLTWIPTEDNTETIMEQLNSRMVPSCQEDEVIVGRGDFNSAGYWGNYYCENVDEVGK